MKRVPAIICIILLLFHCSPALFADEIDTDDVDTGDMSAAGEQGGETVEWGGSFLSSFTQNLIWNTYDSIAGFQGPGSTLFLASVYSSLYFDARPDPSFRVFGRIAADYPFEVEKQIEGENTPLPNIAITELYSDINWFEILYFRTGKQYISWHTGYFFSAVNILNLTPIDYENPDDACEGPLAVAVRFMPDTHTFSLYIVTDDVSNIDEIVIAPKLDFMINTINAGIGLRYKKDSVLCWIATLDSILWDIRLFAEVNMHAGSDRIFIRPGGTAPYVETFRRTDDFFASGTIGFQYMFEPINLELTGQYYYNSEGYADSDLLSAASTALENDLVPGLTENDLLFFGMHYGAFRIKWIGTGLPGVGTSLFWIGNLSDNSGYFHPSVSCRLFEYSEISFGIKFVYGDDTDEFLLTPGRIVLLFGLELGSGGF